MYIKYEIYKNWYKNYYDIYNFDESHNCTGVLQLKLLNLNDKRFH